MKYYTLTNSTEIKKIGHYPQTSVSDGNELFSPFSNVRIVLGDFPKTIPKLCLILNEKSIITDFLDAIVIPFGLIVNEKIKNLLPIFNLPKHKFYSIDVTCNKKLLDYYWLHNYDNVFQYIDMDKSKFEIIQYKNVVTHSFISEDFYKSKKHECIMDFSKTFKITKIILKENFPNYDLFEFENRTLISKRTLDLFVENEITGYEAKLYDIIKR